MDETKLVIIWDEVIGDIISYITDEIASKRSDILEEMVMKPLSHWAVEGSNALYEMLVHEKTFVLASAFFEYICFFIYICCIFYFSLMFLYELIQLLLKKQLFEGLINAAIQPAKSFILLQCIHFIGVPIIKECIVILPKILYEITQFVQSDFIMAQNRIVLNDFPKEQLLLQTVLVVILFISMLSLALQFVQLGLQVILAFIICYIQLIRSIPLLSVFDALKNAFVRIFIMFTIQQLLLFESFNQVKEIQTITQLVNCVAIISFAAYIPKIVQKERKILFA